MQKNKQYLLILILLTLTTSVFAFEVVDIKSRPIIGGITTYKYTFYGYLKDGDTSATIVGAQVKIKLYNNYGSNIASKTVLTKSNGYYYISLSTPQKTNYAYIYFQKYCYNQKTIYKSSPSSYTNFGTKYLYAKSNWKQYLEDDFAINFKDYSAVRSSAKSITSGQKTDSGCRSKIFNYFTNIKGWNYVGGPDRNKASSLINVGTTYTWDCCEVAIWTCAMARSVGIPARVINWRNRFTTSRRDIPDLDPDPSSDNHFFVEMYINGQWLISDLSYDWYSLNDFANDPRIASTTYSISSWNIVTGFSYNPNLVSSYFNYIDADYTTYTGNQYQQYITMR